MGRKISREEAAKLGLSVDTRGGAPNNPDIAHKTIQDSPVVGTANVFQRFLDGIKAAPARFAGGAGGAVLGATVAAPIFPPLGSIAGAGLGAFGGDLAGQLGDKLDLSAGSGQPSTPAQREPLDVAGAALGGLGAAGGQALFAGLGGVAARQGAPRLGAALAGDSPGALVAESTPRAVRNMSGAAMQRMASVRNLGPGAIYESAAAGAGEARGTAQAVEAAAKATQARDAALAAYEPAQAAHGMQSAATAQAMDDFAASQAAAKAKPLYDPARNERIAAQATSSMADQTADEAGKNLASARAVDPAGQAAADASARISSNPVISNMQDKLALEANKKVFGKGTNKVADWLTRGSQDPTVAESNALAARTQQATSAANLEEAKAVQQAAMKPIIASQMRDLPGPATAQALAQREQAQLAALEGQRKLPSQILNQADSKIADAAVRSPTQTASELYTDAAGYEALSPPKAQGLDAVLAAMRSKWGAAKSVMRGMSSPMSVPLGDSTEQVLAGELVRRGLPRTALTPELASQVSPEIYPAVPGPLTGQLLIDFLRQLREKSRSSQRAEPAEEK